MYKFEDFLKGSVAVQCRTHKEAEWFLNILTQYTNIKWKNVLTSPNERVFWNMFEEDTVYLIEDGFLVHGTATRTSLPVTKFEEMFFI